MEQRRTLNYSKKFINLEKSCEPWHHWHLFVSWTQKKSATRWFIPEISKISQWTDSKKSESSRKAQKEFSGSWRSIALDSHHTYIVYEVPALWQILHGSFRKVSGWLRNFVRTYVSTSFLEFATKKFYLEMFYLMRKSRILLICIFLEDEVTKVSFLI